MYYILVMIYIGSIPVRLLSVLTGDLSRYSELGAIQRGQAAGHTNIK